MQSQAKIVTVADAVNFPALDGLRLAASANIVLFHLVASGALVGLASAGWLFPAQKAPLLNTSLFFLLSGFLFQARTGPRIANFRPRAFLKARLNRLLPLHIASTILMAVLGWVRFADQRDPVLILKSLAMHLSLLWAWWPEGTLALNRPSWAVGAFVFCYLLFIPVLPIVQSESSRLRLWTALALCIATLVLWWFSYWGSTNPGTGNQVFNFHHSFPPARFPEFLAGMLLARLRSLSEATRSEPAGWLPHWKDAAILITLVLLWKVQHLLWIPGPQWHWLGYHVLNPVGGALLLWFLAGNRGLVVRLLSLKPIRILGRAGFYPYLLHIPFFALCGIVIEDSLGLPEWLNQPLAIIAFFLVLYTGSAWFDQTFGHTAHKSKRAAA